MKGTQSSSAKYSPKNLCDAKGKEETQERCKAILETIAPGRVKQRLCDGDYYNELRGEGEWVLLGRWNDGRIAVRIYPGNTMCQARAFFKSARKQAFLDLIIEGWQIQPSLALNDRDFFLQTYGNKLSLEQYYDYWTTEGITQVRRENNGFEDFSRGLRARRLIGSEDQRNIKKDFVETKRTFINVCPGFELVYGWRRAEANRLDRDEQFVEAVLSRSNEALGTWGQSL